LCSSDIFTGRFGSSTIATQAEVRPASIRVRSLGLPSSIRGRGHESSPSPSRSYGMGRLWPAVSVSRLR
jgi:hypothetical protein